MKIMIVDDSETLRVQLRRDLEGKGYTVIEAHDGLHGLEVIAQNPDTKLLVCDVNMPRLDGLSMAKKIHERPETKALPILVMTTEVGADLKAVGKEAGVLAWVPKPYNSEKLLMVIAKVLK